MNTLEVGKKIVELCKQGKMLEAINELYSPHIVSIEPFASPGHQARLEGIDAIIGKTKWWMSAHETHGAVINGPWPHGDRFIVHFKFDVTPKEGPMKGKRMMMDEAGLYTVKDGKVVQEEFFYHMGD